MENNKVLNFSLMVLGVGAVAAIYIKYLYKPLVVVKSVDYKAGTSDITINGKDVTLYAGSTYDCGFGWGVKFSPHVNKNSPYFIPRVELVKHHLVHEYLDIYKKSKS
jgi:hypothetical protein